MTVWIDVARAATAVDLVLLAAVAAVWGRNYWRLRSRQTLGMCVFAGFLFAENAFALYVYLFAPVLSVWFSTSVPDVAWRAMVVLHVLEVLAVGTLARVTFD